MTDTGSDDAAALQKKEGNAKFQAGDYDGAIQLYTSSLELDPSQHLCYSNRSACYQKLERYDEALADAKRCIELSPSFAKGYTRAAAAYQGLNLWDQAIEVCEDGLRNSSGDNCTKLINDIKKDKFVDELQGPWHGTVSEALGGYDQAMEFQKDGSLNVEVLGRGSPGKFWVDAGQDPKHLTIQMMPPSQPGMFMPPTPPVPYIAKIDETGLHLCSPYMTMERPADFTGPGYVLMKRGKLEVADNLEMEGVSHAEKLRLCAVEMTEKLPSTKLEEPSQTDSEAQVQEKLMAQVRFESVMFEVQKRYGENVVKEVIEASRDIGQPAVRNMKEIKPLIQKLKQCGLLEDDKPKASPSISQKSEGPKPQAPPGGSKVPESEKAACDRRSELKGDSGLITIASVITVAFLASAAYVLWKRSKR